MRVLVVDAANVVGARPDGWWKDRPGAARRLHESLLVADLPYDQIVVVLEGEAKAGVKAGRDHHVRVVHAPRDGDRAVIEEVTKAIGAGHQVLAITSDRVLGARAANLGARTMSAGWLLEHL